VFACAIRVIVDWNPALALLNWQKNEEVRRSSVAKENTHFGVLPVPNSRLIYPSVQDQR
jgi:hypothetical protein